jgi:nucleoid-associated protein YgaU
MAEPNLDQLKQKYQAVINLIPQTGATLKNVHIEGGKLLIRAEAPSQEAKNRIWDQIKLIDPSYSDLTADITVAAGAPSVQAAGASASPGQSRQTYTVQPGDTLSKIAKQFLGDASQYNRIFEANRDQLKDPDKIRPGQKLVIPE